MPKRRNLNNIKLSSVKRTISKLRRNENAKKVRKMLAAVMEHQQARQVNGNGAKSSDTSVAQTNSPDTEEFYSSGRTGRRNALPDILGENAHVSSSDLPARLQALTTTSDQDKISVMEASEAGPSSRTST